MNRRKFIIYAFCFICFVSGLTAQNQMEVIYEFEGEYPGSRFGESLTSLDFNGDGLEDLLVGTSYWNLMGRIYVYYGGDDFENGPHLTISGDADNVLDIRLVALGDMNGDGYEDFATPNYDRDTYLFQIFIFYGSAEPDSIPDYVFTPSATAMGATYRFHSLGDVNNDGFDDMGIAEYPGDFYILWGGSTLDLELFYQATISLSNEQFFKGIGDINNDGYHDFVIRFKYDILLYKLLLFYGSSTINNTPDATLWDGSYGILINKAGDWNLDGYDDYYLRLPYEPLKLYPGGEELATQSILSIDYWAEMFDCGDLNGDGYLDVAMGDPLYYLGDGQLFAYLGGEQLNDTMDWWITYPFSDYALGGEVVMADFDNDGYSDIAATAVGYNDATGKVIIYAGNPNLEDLVPVNDNTVPSNDAITFDAFPNPFNPTVTFEIKAEDYDNFQIDIFNIKGQRVKTLSVSPSQSHTVSITWNAEKQASGMYYCKLVNVETQQVLSTRKVTLIK